MAKGGFEHVCLRIFGRGLSPSTIDRILGVRGNRPLTNKLNVQRAQESGTEAVLQWNYLVPGLGRKSVIRQIEELIGLLEPHMPALEPMLTKWGGCVVFDIGICSRKLAMYIRIPPELLLMISLLPARLEISIYALA